MSFSDDALQLERSFVLTKDLLQQLLRALEERRAAWVSVRPDVLKPSSQIEQLSQQLAVEEDRRNELVRRLRVRLPTPLGRDPEKLHINVTRISAALPTAQGRALRAAADAVQPLAKLVRTEVTLGQRLLRFAQNAQSGVEASIAGVTRSKQGSGYDRRARNVTKGGGAGQLVDGRI